MVATNCKRQSDPFGITQECCERDLPISASRLLLARQDDAVVFRRRESLYKQFVRTGGVLWANPGAVLEVRPITGAAESIQPEAETWPGYMVLSEDQVAWAVETDGDFSQGIVSLLGITDMSRNADRLTIRYIAGNPRQPVAFKGLLGAVMASTSDVPHEVSLDFPTGRAAEQMEQAIQQQRTVARERWPGLAVTPRARDA